MKTALVTGGAGYLGGNFLIFLLNKKFKVVVIDNFINSSRHEFFILQNKLKYKFENRLYFYQGDINNLDLVISIFHKHEIDYVYHFAALKSVPESLKKPSFYLLNNFHYAKKFLNLLVENFKFKAFIFSSSATVYGDSSSFPVCENSPLSYKNPYGLSKILFEDYLKKISIYYKDIKFVSLRYFNPLGSVFNNLYPEYFFKNEGSLSLAIKKLVDSDFKNYFYIYGDDYNSIDGSPVRDFIHIADLLDGHYFVSCNIDKLSNYEVFNLGTGKGTTVLQFVKELENAFNKKINYKFVPRRRGDIAISYANVQKIEDILKWKSNFTVTDICSDIASVYKK